MEQVKNKIIGVRKAGIAAVAIGALSVNSDTMKIENAVIIGIVAIVAIIAHMITGIKKNVVSKAEESENTGS
jgi:hypothetical protein